MTKNDRAWRGITLLDVRVILRHDEESKQLLSKVEQSQSSGTAAIKAQGIVVAAFNGRTDCRGMNGDLSALRAWITLVTAHMRSVEACEVEPGADRGPDDHGQGGFGDENG